MTDRPRLLFVSPRFLFPMNEGGKIRTGKTLQHMKGGVFDITLASPAPIDHTRFTTDIDAACDRFLPWAATPTSIVRKLVALLDAVPVSVATDRSAAGSNVVRDALLQRPDIVVVDFPHAAVLMPAPIPGASLLFTHNVEAEIYERHAATAAGLRRLVWRDQARKMQRFERQAVHAVGRVVAVSRRDAKALGERYDLADVDAIDTGVDLAFFAFNEAERPGAVEPDGGRIVFTGVMDSPANIDGVTFFMNEIWPLVSARRPAAEAVIVGRNPQPVLREAARARRLNWTFTGFVDDIRPYVAAADVSIIPLRVGSGTRIKAFESMAMGRPVVATTIGIEGLDISPDAHYLRADTPAEFAAAILRLLDDEALRARLRQAARARMDAHFGWDRIARQFEAVCVRTIDAAAH